MSTYQPTYPIVDGLESVTLRLPCCGAGVGHRDERTGERLHFSYCEVLQPVNDTDRQVAAVGLPACRAALDGGWTDLDSARSSFDDHVDAGRLD